MKLIISLMLTVAFSILIITSSTLASSMVLVGVKEGDWMEYDISITGTGIMPPTHDVRWMRIEVLQIQDTAFSANFTSKYANGSIGSAIWKFNFTEGSLGGWTIIPANLSPGETFFDSSIHNDKSVNVTIQSQEEKLVLGATRNITYGNDSIRHIKEWDKTTGMFIGSSETIRNATTKDGWYIENLTVTTKAIATNMWVPQVISLEQPVFALISSSAIFVVVLLIFAAAIFEMGRIKKIVSRFRLLEKKSFGTLFFIIVILFGAGMLISFFWFGIGLSDAEMNLIMQSFWTALIIGSFGLRKSGNYFVHGIIMAIVVIATLVSFSLVVFMSTPTSGSMEIYFSSPLKIVEFAAHSILSIPAIAFGIWFVALWRPNSTSAPFKTQRAAKLTVIFWVLSYFAGVLGYIADYTTLFGLI